MFKRIQVFKDFKMIGEQNFSHSVFVLPIVGQFIKVKGMNISYKVKYFTLNYEEETIEVTVS